VKQTSVHLAADKCACIRMPANRHCHLFNFVQETMSKTLHLGFVLPCGCNHFICRGLKKTNLVFHKRERASRMTSSKGSDAICPAL